MHLRGAHSFTSSVYEAGSSLQAVSHHLGCSNALHQQADSYRVHMMQMFSSVSSCNLCGMHRSPLAVTPQGCVVSMKCLHVYISTQPICEVQTSFWLHCLVKPLAHYRHCSCEDLTVPNTSTHALLTCMFCIPSYQPSNQSMGCQT